MKKTITALFAAAAIVLGGAASVAIAVPYVPDGNGGTIANSNVAPGGTVVLPFTGFDPQGGLITFTLTGENASGATLASSGVLAVVDSKSLDKAPDGNGAASVSVTLPTNASGVYTLTGTQGAASASTTITATTAATGVDIPAWLVWGAVGAVGLGVIALIAVSAARRTRRVAVAQN